MGEARRRKAEDGGRKTESGFAVATGVGTFRVFKFK
jgi:hypothetical protein